MNPFVSDIVPIDFDREDHGVIEDFRLASYAMDRREDDDLHRIVSKITEVRAEAGLKTPRVPNHRKRRGRIDFT